MFAIVPTFPRDQRLVEIDEVDSTNAEAMRRAVAGERGPLWIRTDRQTAGRGRSGRAWEMAEGNLAATLMFSPACPPAALYQLSLLAGGAVHDAAAASGRAAGGGSDLRLKWPNDILLSGAKLGGILVESTSLGGEVVAAVGIGINIGTAPRVPGRNTARLQDFGDAPSPRELLAVLATRMAKWLSIWDRGNGFPAIRQAWIERSLPTGQAITINDGRESVSGRFDGRDTDGALFLRDRDGRQRRFTVGDVDLAHMNERVSG